jgi:hypothetical protein
MRPPRSCHVYKDGECIKHFDMLAKASDYTNESVPIMRRSLELKKPTKRGYLYTDNQLTQKEIYEIYAHVTPRKKCNVEQKAKQNHPSEDLGFYIPTAKEDKKKLLKQYISANLTKKWLQMSVKQADMERRFLRNLVDSL